MAPVPRRPSFSTLISSMGRGLAAWETWLANDAPEEADEGFALVPAFDPARYPFGDWSIGNEPPADYFGYGQGWSDKGAAGEAPVGVRVDDQGQLHLRGTIRSDPTYNHPNAAAADGWINPALVIPESIAGGAGGMLGPGIQVVAPVPVMVRLPGIGGWRRNVVDFIQATTGPTIMSVTQLLNDINAEVIGTPGQVQVVDIVLGGIVVPRTPSLG